MGTPLRLLERKGEWWRVQSPDGYISYVPVSSLQKFTMDEMKSWRSANRLIVKSLPQIRVYNSPEATSVRDIVTEQSSAFVDIPPHKYGVPIIE